MRRQISGRVAEPERMPPPVQVQRHVTAPRRNGRSVAQLDTLSQRGEQLGRCQPAEIPDDTVVGENLDLIVGKRHS